jgi:N utilization substance protein B
MNPLAGLEPDEIDIIEALPYHDERSLSRRMALQILYEVDTAGHAAAAVLERHLDERAPSARAASYARTLIEGVMRHRPIIDPVIAAFAPDFPLEQLAVVDRNVLRLALYEFAVSGRVPVGVAIDQGVELARLFGSDNSMAFINGVLGAIADDPSTIERLHTLADPMGAPPAPEADAADADSEAQR